MAGRRHDRGELSLRLEAYRNGRVAIAELAHDMLGELSTAVDLLDGIGFPFSLQELGIERKDALLPFRNIRLLRRRYSTFDLAYDLGLQRLMDNAGKRFIEGGE